MVTITYIQHDGTRHDVTADIGTSVMQTARAHGVDGIVAECGGACSCATCHVYVDTDWITRLPPMDELEEEMLEFAYEPDPARSRLSCQIEVSDELDGLVVFVPEQQG